MHRPAACKCHRVASNRSDGNAAAPALAAVAALALGAGGEAGLIRALDLLLEETHISLGLAGQQSTLLQRPPPRRPLVLHSR